MQNYSVTLDSPASNSFRCSLAANSVDLDVSKKLRHHFTVAADIDAPWNVGLIVGASGSGKTTLAKAMFGEDCFANVVDMQRPVIDQFPEDWTYEQCQAALIGIGLSQVACWVRPMCTLSNGQTHRAVAALTMAKQTDFVVDEWTSVADRTVGKAMSLCLGKHARKTQRRVVAVSCHYDVMEWLDPDWLIDCNKAQYHDRRLLRRGERAEKLCFEIRRLDNSRSWAYFSKYHYLSDKVPGGLTRFYGLFHEGEQIGFQCFANYTPRKAGQAFMMHPNRTVVHPDYVGLGLGMRVIEATSLLMHNEGFDVRAKFSSVPVARAFEKSKNWRLDAVQRFTASGSRNMQRQTGFRQAVKTYSYRFKPTELPAGVSLEAA
jgi:ABC-type Mn2+/Zn2+ transport system ATPase subunit/GNAT superfamily N-acetyltransferase